MSPGTSGPLHAMRNWDYDDTRFKTVRIEDFTLQPSRWAADLIPMSRPCLPPDWRFTFEAFSGGRPRGSVDDSSHYRSGDPGEWRKYIPPAILRYVQNYFDGLLRPYYPELLAMDAIAAPYNGKLAACAIATGPAGSTPAGTAAQNPLPILGAGAPGPQSKKAQQNRARG